MVRISESVRMAAVTRERSAIVQRLTAIWKKTAFPRTVQGGSSARHASPHVSDTGEGGAEVVLTFRRGVFFSAILCAGRKKGFGGFARV